MGVGHHPLLRPCTASSRKQRSMKRNLRQALGFACAFSILRIPLTVSPLMISARCPSTSSSIWIISLMKIFLDLMRLILTSSPSDPSRLLFCCPAPRAGLSLSPSELEQFPIKEQILFLLSYFADEAIDNLPQGKGTDVSVCEESFHQAEQGETDPA